MSEKRAIYPNKVLPYLLLVPQLAITIILFIWPAGQANQMVIRARGPIGFRTAFVWFENHRRLFADPSYLQALGQTAIFPVSVTVLAMSISRLLAVAVGRLLKSAWVYTTLLVWPYAVAPVVAVSCGGSCSTRRWASYPMRCASSASAGTTASTGLTR